MHQKLFRTMPAVALLFASAAVFAQPVLQNNVFPGFVQAMSSVSAADSNAVQEGPAGANITWDFSGLTPASGTQTVVSFQLPAGSPFAAQFPTSNLMGVYSVDGETAYVYFQYTDNEFRELGLGIGTYVAVYDNPQTVLNVPLTYNGNFNDDYSGVLSIDGFLINLSGESESQYDAYGTLKLPGGTFNNAIRLKTVSFNRDTADLGGALSITESSATTYSWYVANRPGPQATIDYSDITYYTVIPGFPPQVEELPTEKQITYSNAGTTSVADVPRLQGVEVSFAGANPVADQLSLNVQSSDAGRNLQLQVFDRNGRMLNSQVLTTSGDRQRVDIPVSQFTAGVYFVSLTDGQARQTKGWVKL